jgi:hypothetical protein
MHALKLTLYKPSSKQCLPYPDWRIGEHAEDLMMSQLEELTLDERRIAKEFRLTQYFNRNKKYADFQAYVAEELTKSIWGKLQDWRGITDHTRKALMVFLGNSAEFFEYANDIYGRMHTTKNVSGNWDRPPIPMNDWERLCKTAAKILVSRGLEHEKRK